MGAVGTVHSLANFGFAMPQNRPLAAPKPPSFAALPAFGASAAGWQSVGRITDPRLPEISGVIVSRAHPGTLWVHNDSGDSPRVFAIGTNGAVQAEVDVDGAQAVDWEDISFGRGPAGTSGDWIYTSDTGNNHLSRDVTSIYRFAEPSTIANQHVSAQRLNLRFAGDARHNIEAMFVDPDSGDITLVTKTLLPNAEVFRIPAQAFDGSTVVPQKVGEISVGIRVTGADISEDGSRIVVRTNSEMSVWTRATGQTIAQALAGRPVQVAAPSEGGEAIGFTPDATSWFSIAEGVGRDVFTGAVPSPRS